MAEEMELQVLVDSGVSFSAKQEMLADQDLSLDRHNWYLGGEVTTDAAQTVLKASNISNCFGVYRRPDKGYMLSSKVMLADMSEEIYEHLVIDLRESGKFRIKGQTVSYDDITEAVSQFVNTFDPPLAPALQAINFETQFSMADEPPDYERANKVLKPDIAPLPNITAVSIVTAKEAKTGRISPSFSFLESNGSHRPIGISMPQWNYYRTKHCCHPLNVCFGCCYRKKIWDGYGYTAENPWYHPSGNGPLRLLGLIIFYLFCGIFLCCYLSLSRCCFICGYN